MSSRPRATLSSSAPVEPAGASASGASASSQGPDLLTVTRSATLKDAIGALLPSDEAMLRSSVFPILASTQPDESVLSALSRNNDPRHPSNYFQRSAPSPRQQVRSVTYLPRHAAGPDDTTTWNRGANGQGTDDDDDDDDDSALPTDAWDEARVRSATFRAEPDGGRREVMRAAFPYEPGSFDRDVLKSFLRSYYGTTTDGGAAAAVDAPAAPGPAAAEVFLQGVDVTVEVANQPSYVASPMVVVITATSANREHDRALQFLFPGLFGGPASSPSASAATTFVGPGSSLALTTPEEIHEMATAAADDPRDVFSTMSPREYGGYLTNEAAGRAFFDWLRPAVHAAAASPNTSNVQAHFRLVPGDEGQLYARVVVYKLDPAEAIRGLTREEVRELPVFPPLPPPGLDELGTAAADRGGPSREEEDEEERPAKARKLQKLSPLPGLEGIDTHQMGQPFYDKYRVQYAEGSYETDKFEPFLIARPKNESEVIKLVQFAIRNGKRVVARSGGHQYCGFSSGDERYVQIVMDDFMKNQDIEVVPTSKPAAQVRDIGCSLVSPDSEDRQWFVELAPRFLLKDVSDILLKNNLTIPHGECPLVGIGGHVQTGGYGHQMRGLGLCLDYVYSFDIVVANKFKDADSVRKVTVYRPEVDEPEKDAEWNDKLYKGVLGGSPGAFGVITKIVFLAAHDEDPSMADPRNVQKILPYQGADVAPVTAQVVRTMLKFASPSKLCEGLDVFVTIMSKVVVTPFEWAMVIPELAYTGEKFSANVENQIKEILDACKGKVIASLPLGQPLQKRLPSTVAHTGIRKLGSDVTDDGREFPLQYKKRVNVMLDTDSMSETDTNKFAQEFGKLASDVVRDLELRLVIQMYICGGKAVSNDAAKSTGLPYRNQSFSFVFDVFYTNERAKTRAVDIQDKLQSLLDEVGEGTCFKHRLLWGSFGRESRETDMSRTEVQKLYYGEGTAYRDLQVIKNLVDPNDTFTTEFTVQKSSGQNSQSNLSNAVRE